MIIDSHCHAGKGDGLTGPWDTNAPLDDYLRRARACGVDRTVLFAAFTSDYERANADVGRLVLASPQRFYGYAMVDGARDAGNVAAMIDAAVRGWGACGIKVHRHDGRITREILEASRAHHLPVLYDVMGETSAVELIATEYPDVAIIVPHLGSFADDWRAHLAVIDLITRHRNVFTDTSGVRRFDQLVSAVRRAGPSKILFGTDGPWLHPAVELAKIRALGLPTAAEQLILSGNWLRLTARARRAPRARTRGRPTRSVTSPRPAQSVQHERGDPWVGLAPGPVEHRA